MASVMEAVEVDVPVRTAYNQWTQFEEFPQFMEGVTQVRQIDDTHLAWTAEIAGATKEWTAEVTEQLPDERVAWKSEGGTWNAGEVTFHKIDDGRCRVMAQIDADPDGLVESVADAIGVLERRVKSDLERLKSSSRAAARSRAPGAARSSRTSPPELTRGAHRRR